MPDPKRMKDLPNELLVKIMNYLPTTDIYNTFGLVCKEFHDLTFEIKYLKIKYIQNNHRHHWERIIKIVKSSKSLIRLTFDLDCCSKKPVISMAKVIKECKNLKSLIVENHFRPYYVDLSTDLIKSVTNRFDYNKLRRFDYDKLRHLKLQGGFCHSDQVAEISKLKNLTSLHLELNRDCRDVNVFKRLPKIGKLKYLKSLHIQQNNDSFMLNFPNLQYPVLEKLSLGTCGMLTSSNIEKFINISPKLKLIRILGNIQIPEYETITDEKLMLEIVKEHNLCRNIPLLHNEFIWGFDLNIELEPEDATLDGMRLTKKIKNISMSNMKSTYIRS